MAHGEFLRQATGSDTDAIIAFARDWRSAPLDDADRAMLEFAEKIARDASAISRADHDRLRAVGFTDEDILDIVLLACYRVFINKLGDALGVELDGPFQKDPRLVEALAVGRPV